jgi:hypothetical protein
MMRAMKFFKLATDEVNTFQRDLLASVDDMKSGRAARAAQVMVTATSEVRSCTGAHANRVIGVKKRVTNNAREIPS